MGVDIRHNKDRKVRRKAPKSKNVYLELLVKLYRFLARRTQSKFNGRVVRRLYLSRSNRPPLSLSRLVKQLTLKHTIEPNRIAVVISTVTNDTRIYDVPKMTVAALAFTQKAKERILAAGGECLTLDQLAVRDPLGNNCMLLEGPRKAAKKYKYFGAPGVPGSSTRPLVRSKGRKFERARGRRASRGYKKH